MVSLSKTSVRKLQCHQQPCCGETKKNMNLGTFYAIVDGYVLYQIIPHINFRNPHNSGMVHEGHSLFMLFF